MAFWIIRQLDQVTNVVTGQTRQEPCYLAGYGRKNCTWNGRQKRAARFATRAEARACLDQLRAHHRLFTNIAVVRVVRGHDPHNERLLEEVRAALPPAPKGWIFEVWWNYDVPDDETGIPPLEVSFTRGTKTTRGGDEISLVHYNDSSNMTVFLDIPAQNFPEASFDGDPSGVAQEMNDMATIASALAKVVYPATPPRPHRDWW
jgi:hypothetical protein